MTESVKNELSDICRIIDATVDTEKIYLFGSYAYGTPTDIVTTICASLSRKIPCVRQTRSRRSAVRSFQRSPSPWM